MIRACLTALFLFVFALPALAQDTAPKAAPLLLLKQNPPSHPERVVLAYYRLAGLEPDVMKWARLSPFLDKAAPQDRDAIISREANRLRRAWSEYDMTQPLVVHTKIQLNDYSTIQEMLHLSEFSAKAFFSFSLYGENIAIVPKDIASFENIPITRTQMEEILKKSNGSNVKTEILLKPVFVDSKTPFVRGNTSYWLLLADIAEIRLWTDGTREPELLWMQRASWYRPKTDTSLLDLKENPQ